MKLLKLALVSTLIFAHFNSYAEEDTAPLEPPYIEEESSDLSFQDDEGVEINNEVPPPPKEAYGDNNTEIFPESDPFLDETEETVNAQKKTDPAKDSLDKNSRLEDELQEESAVVGDELFEDETSVVEENNIEDTVVPEMAEPEVQVVGPTNKTPKSEVVRQSSSGGVEYIRHPQSANGLIAITKDGTYIYDVRKKNEKIDVSGAFRIGMMDSPRIYAADGTSYQQMYSDSSSPYLMFDYEFKPLDNLRALAVQMGAGVLYAQGNGRFVNVNPGDTSEAKEKYSFFAVPLNLGLVLRLQWADYQWFVPYVAGGGSYIGIAEMRDDGKGPNVVGTPAAYGAGGLLINITAMSRSAAFSLNSEYGIKNLFVGLEYRRLQTFNEDLDFSSNIISAGVAVDY